MEIIFRDNKENKDKPYYKWLNSPLFISVVGALFLAWIANFWEEKRAEETFQRETLILLADQFPKILIFRIELDSRGFYIKKNRSLEASDRNVYNDGRSFADTILQFEKIEGAKGVGAEYHLLKSKLLIVI